MGTYNEGFGLGGSLGDPPEETTLELDLEKMQELGAGGSGPCTAGRGSSDAGGEEWAPGTRRVCCGAAGGGSVSRLLCQLFKGHRLGAPLLGQVTSGKSRNLAKRRFLH